MAFKQMQNISFFLDAIRDIGVLPSESFQTVGESVRRSLQASRNTRTQNHLLAVRLLLLFFFFYRCFSHVLVAIVATIDRVVLSIHMFDKSFFYLLTTRPPIFSLRFCFADLYEKQNMGQVVVCILALERRAAGKGVLASNASKALPKSDGSGWRDRSLSVLVVSLSRLFVLLTFVWSLPYAVRAFRIPQRVRCLLTVTQTYTHTHEHYATLFDGLINTHKYAHTLQLSLSLSLSPQPCRCRWVLTRVPRRPACRSAACDKRAARPCSRRAKATEAAVAASQALRRRRRVRCSSGKSKFCSGCGKPAGAGNFCAGCGNKL
jgi:hypothetical protein